MRLLFDGFWWAKGPTANRRVMREFIFAWRRAFPRDELIVAVRSEHAATADLPDGVRAVTTRLAPQALSNAFELPVLARRLGVDATIAHNYTPLSGRSLVFIHDLLFEEHPEWFSRKERLYFAPMAALARRAAAVTTSSRAEAERIRSLHPSLAPVWPVGLAVSPDLAQAVPSRPAAVDDVDRFVLSVGRLNKRKNLGVAIDGAMRSQAVTPDRPLLVVGSADFSGASADLPSSVREHVESGRLRFLGRITDGELRWVYERADCLVFLSRDEGFGLPPIEARHFGTPVVVSDIPVMREVAGTDARFVAVDEPDQVARAIDDAIRGGRGGAPGTAQVETDWDDIAGSLRARLSREIPTELGAGL